MSKRVCLVDAGTGNLRSVQHTLLALGAEVLRTDSPADLNSAGCLVLPGVGAFGRFMAGLNEKGLANAIKDAVGRGVPVLGICVGMQALFELSNEMGEFPGLGLIPGQVKKFPDQPALKIPHTGWNQFHSNQANPLLKGLEENAYAYFNHSYYCRPDDALDVLAETDYGIRYASIVQHQNLFGVQFHPEKSQRVGLTLLANFLELA
jgi:imidazole glycerol-phosphate synthase subunit HisH